MVIGLIARYDICNLVFQASWCCKFENNITAVIFINLYDDYRLQRFSALLSKYPMMKCLVFQTRLEQ